MLKKQIRPNQKRVFKIFETGTGEVPLALLKKARTSLRKKKRREFTGVDQAMNIDALLTHAKIKRLPKNLQLIQNCAIKALAKAPKESQDIIFGSYLINNLDGNEFSCAVKHVPCDKAIFITSERALKPGGRMIFVQDKLELPQMKEAAANLGLHLHTITIPDSKAKNSTSEAIRFRSNPEAREKFLLGRIKQRGDTPENFLRDLAPWGVKSIEDAVHPTIYLFRKPRSASEQQGRINTQKEISAERIIALFECALGIRLM